MKTKYLLILILCTVPCKSQVKSYFEFDPRTLDKNEITLAEIADDITYIPLDNSIPLGVIYNYKFINNSIYLSAKDIGILAFNRNGKILGKIGSIGRGPGEYTYYVYFTVDDKKETVYVLNSGNTIMEYSKTGKFLKRLSLSKYGGGIEAIETYNSKLFASFFLQLSGAKNDWIILDTLGNLIYNNERTIPPFSSGFGVTGGTYKLDNRMFYWNHYNDTVYSISGDLSKKPSFIISPGEYRLPRSNFNPFKQLSQYMQLQQIFETSRFLVIRYFYKKMAIVLIDKKTTRKSFVAYIESGANDNGDYSFGGIINNFDGGTMFLPKSYFVENEREYMIGLINPYQD